MIFMSSQVVRLRTKARCSSVPTMGTVVQVFLMGVTNGYADVPVCTLIGIERHWRQTCSTLFGYRSV